MPNALSADVRCRFRKLFEDGLTGREAARRLLISASSASRMARKLKRGKGLEPAPNRRKTGRGKLAHGVCASVSALIRPSNGSDIRSKKEPHCG